MCQFCLFEDVKPGQGLTRVFKESVSLLNKLTAGWCCPSLASKKEIIYIQ